MKKLFITFSLLFSFLFVANAQILYKVSGNGLTKPSYLFGTHHLAPLSVFTDNQAAQAAFNEAEQVVGEIDMTGDQNALALKMQPYMIAPSDSTLSKVIPADQYANVELMLREAMPMPGVSLSNFEPFKPIIVTQQIAIMIIMQNMPEFKANENLDLYFLTTGKMTGKKIIALETAEQQAEILYCNASIASQVEDLIEMANNPEEIFTQAQRLNEAYFAQDLAALYDLAKEDESNPEFFEKLLNERNNNWMTQLPGIMREGSTFIAVGCLHLAGEIGLINQLRQLGYTVESID